MEFTLWFRSEKFKLFLTALGIPWRYLRDTLEYISYWCSAYVCVRRKGLLFRTNLKNTGLDTAFSNTCDWIHFFGQPHHTWFWLVKLCFSFCLYLYRFFFLIIIIVWSQVKYVTYLCKASSCLVLPFYWALCFLFSFSILQHTLCLLFGITLKHLFYLFWCLKQAKDSSLQNPI